MLLFTEVRGRGILRRLRMNGLLGIGNVGCSSLRNLTISSGDPNVRKAMMPTYTSGQRPREPPPVKYKEDTRVSRSKAREGAYGTGRSGERLSRSHRRYLGRT